MFKRIQEHLYHCKSYILSKDSEKSKSLDNNVNSISNKNSKYTFDNNLVIKNYMSSLMDKYKYLTINNNFIYFPSLQAGEGTFGLVVFGIKIDCNTPVAVKVQKRSSNFNDLRIEQSILNLTKNNLYFPKLFYYEENEEGNLLIESLFGPSLSKLFKFCDYSFDLVTVYQIGIDILNALEVLHDNGYLYMDMKEDNIVILLNNLENKKENLCTLIDFGKCFYYKNKIFKKRKKINLNKIEGNICFTSVNVLKEEIPERIDDIISLSYLLIYLNKGCLPWSNRKNK